MNFAEQAKYAELLKRVDTLEKALIHAQAAIIKLNDYVLQADIKRGPGRPRKEDQREVA